MSVLSKSYVELLRDYFGERRDHFGECAVEELLWATQGPLLASVLWKS